MLDIKQKYHIKGKAGKQTDKLAHVSTAAVILMALYLLILRYIQIYHKKQKKKNAHYSSCLYMFHWDTKQDFTAQILREGGAHLTSCL